jgi:phosphoglycolate phosphatase
VGVLDGHTIVFDLDGTLVDSAPDLIRATNRLMAEIGLPPAPADEFRSLVGQGARVLVERASARAGVVHAPERLAALSERFVALYAEDIASESVLFPGVIDALDQLHAEGARLAVCTNKRTGLSTQLLDALGVLGRFAAIVGADAVPARKPDAGHLIATVERARGLLARTVLVGDTMTDVLAARNAGAPVILTCFGYAEADPASMGADALITSFADLRPTLRALWGR